MMTSHPVPSHAEEDSNRQTQQQAAIDEKSFNLLETDTMPAIEELHCAESASPKTEISEIPLDLPEPDADNITVLTDKLPNKPILPWNHYDSPWEELAEEETVSETQSEPEASTDVDAIAFEEE